MYIKLRWSLAKYADHIRFLPFGEKWKYLWKEGWTNVPEMMIGVPITVACTATMIYYAFKLGEFVPRKYHQEIVIYRPGDPRIAKIPKVDRIDRF